MLHIVPGYEETQVPASSPIVKLYKRIKPEAKLAVASFAIGYAAGFESAIILEQLKAQPVTPSLHTPLIPLGKIIGIDMVLASAELVAVRGKGMETHETTLLAGVSGYAFGAATKCLISSQSVEQGVVVLLAALGAMTLAASLVSPGKPSTRAEPV